MKNLKETLQDIKQNGFQLDFGVVFSQAFESYKKIALNGGAAILLFTLLVGIIAAGLLVGILGLGSNVEQLREFEITDFSLSALAIYIFSMILFSCLASPFSAGLLKMARNAAKGEEVSVGVSFEYYGNRYFKDIFLATLILSCFTTIISVGLEYYGYQILGAFINLLVSFLTFLTIPMIIFGDLKPLEAIQASITVVSKQFFIILGLLIVAGLFSMIGIFAFCLGIFFTFPIISAVSYHIFAAAVHDDSNHDILPEVEEPWQPEQPGAVEDAEDAGPEI